MKLLTRYGFSSQRGAAAVEFALVVPILLLILFGIIEFSLLLYNKHIITNASREAARFGIVQDDSHRDLVAIRDVVYNWIQMGGNSSLVTFGTDTITDDDISVCKHRKEDGNPADPTTWTWDCTASDVDNANFGDKLRVNISYDYDFLVVPGFISNLAGGLTIDAETIMNYE